MLVTTVVLVLLILRSSRDDRELVLGLAALVGLFVVVVLVVAGAF